MQIPAVDKVVTWAKEIVQLVKDCRVLRTILRNTQKAGNTKPLLLITDCTTRWNYTLLMLERIYELGDFLKLSFEQLPAAMGVTSDQLERANDITHEWDKRTGEIVWLILILRPCLKATKDMEGRTGTLSQALFLVDGLTKKLQVRNAYCIIHMV